MVTFKAIDFKATKKQIEFIESRIRINSDYVQELFIKFNPRKNNCPKSCGPKSCGPKT